MRRLHDSERGAAALEMVFATLFILLPIFIGVLDLGRAFSASIAMSDVAQQSAVFAAFEGASAESDIQDHAVAISSFPITTANVSADCEVRTADDLDGSAVRVVVDVAFDGFFIKNIPLARSAYVEGVAPCDW